MRHTLNILRTTNKAASIAVPVKGHSCPWNRVGRSELKGCKRYKQALKGTQISNLPTRSDSKVLKGRKKTMKNRVGRVTINRHSYPRRQPDRVYSAMCNHRE